jgi:hypothetical protein
MSFKQLLLAHRTAWSGLVLVALVVLAGCGTGGTGGSRIGNVRPQIEISSGPLEGSEEIYSVRMNWFAYDRDGQVTRYIYAVDPPVQGDTAWTETRASEVTIFYRSPNPTSPLPALGSVVIARGYHTFVIKAIDNEGLGSPPVSRSFTSRTVAPSTAITTPRPTRQQPVSTTPSITLEWQGTDPDGVLTQKPVKYKFKLVPATDIDPGNPEGITAQQIQDYFGRDADTFFAAWDSVAGDTTSRFYEGLTPQTKYYFAIVAFDEAGAFEPRFNLDSNVLQFRPTLDKLGPVITVFNEFFSRTQGTGGISLAPSRIVKLEFPSDSPITFNWSATPPTGALITGYRWCVDIEGQDIGNETPRRDDNDLNHWSSWSLNEVAATVGPFVGSVDSTVIHYFYLEARDNLGFVSLFTIELRIVEPSFARQVMVVDDLYGTASASPFRYVGPYPMEAEQDSFYFAKGGYPDSLRIQAENLPTALSVAGSFSDFAVDTVDYRFYPNEGILLSDLAQYRVVCWYTDNTSSSRNGSKFGSTQPATAIRLINSVNRLNTLAVYLRQGGKAWLFGDGITTAIANGYWSRFSSGAAILPYTAGETRNDILKVGNFLYDFCHMRSELYTAGTNQVSLTINQQIAGAIPYLPEFRGPATQTDRSKDPRIGSGAERTALRWAGLPRLTVRNYRGSTLVNGYRSFNQTFIISKPNFITEGSGASFRSVLDTLYLCQARLLDLNSVQVPPSDGRPNAVHYYGSEHGDVVWMGFPLYIFEPDQAREVVRKVMEVFGVPQATPRERGAYPQASSQPVVRVIDGGETTDTRRAQR